jgi:hypothetical protein
MRKFISEWGPDPRLDPVFLTFCKLHVVKLAWWYEDLLYERSVLSDVSIVSIVTYCRITVSEGSVHRVDRMLSFFFSRRNWDSPNPSPAGEFAPLSEWRGTLVGEKGGGRVPIPTRSFSC